MGNPTVGEHLQYARLVEAGRAVILTGVVRTTGTQDVDFEAENLALRNENVDLRAENEDLSLLVQDYETVLEKVLEGLRVYAVCYSSSTSYPPGRRKP